MTSESKQHILDVSELYMRHILDSLGLYGILSQGCIYIGYIWIF